MNKAQEKAINLLKEMKDICDANKIPFFLIGSYALRAFRSGSFESDACNLEVGMLYKDVIKFKNAVSCIDDERRCLESLYTNPQLKSHYFRYVDKETLYFPLKNNINIKEFGISINIIPFYSTKCEKKMSLEKLIYYSWIRNHTKGTKNNNLKNKIKRKSIKMLGRLVHDNSPNKMLKALEKLEENASVEDPLYYRKHMTFKMIKMPKGIFKSFKKVEFEGVECNIAGEIESYLSTVIGQDWTERRYTNKEIRHAVVCSSEISYKDYFNYLKEQNLNYNYLPLAKKVERARKKVKIYNKTIKDAWEQVSLSYDRVSRHDI